MQQLGQLTKQRKHPSSPLGFPRTNPMHIQANDALTKENNFHPRNTAAGASSLLGTHTDNRTKYLGGITSCVIQNWDHGLHTARVEAAKHMPSCDIALSFFRERATEDMARFYHFFFRHLETRDSAEYTVNRSCEIRFRQPGSVGTRDLVSLLSIAKEE